MRKIPESMLRYDRKELEELIDRYVIFRRKSERNRAILKRSMLDGICYEPLAEEFDMSVSQIKDVIYKSQEQLFAHIK